MKILLILFFLLSSYSLEEKYDEVETQSVVVSELGEGIIYVNLIENYNVLLKVNINVVLPDSLYKISKYKKY